MKSGVGWPNRLALTIAGSALVAILTIAVVSRDDADRDLRPRWAEKRPRSTEVPPAGVDDPDLDRLWDSILTRESNGLGYGATLSRDTLRPGERAVLTLLYRNVSDRAFEIETRPLCLGFYGFSLIRPRDSTEDGLFFLTPYSTVAILWRLGLLEPGRSLVCEFWIEIERQDDGAWLVVTEPITRFRASLPVTDGSFILRHVYRGAGERYPEHRRPRMWGGLASLESRLEVDVGGGD